MSLLRLPHRKIGVLISLDFTRIQIKRVTKGIFKNSIKIGGGEGEMFKTEGAV